MPAADVADLPVTQLINPATGVTLEYTGRWLRPGKASMGDVKRGWARYPGDKVWLSLPPGVQKQLDAGRLQIAGQYEARARIEASQTPEAAMPKGNASHETWLSYAVEQGMPRGEAVELTRDQIKARFTAPSFDPDAAPEEIGGDFELLNAKP
jgi:hypothetical protein